MHEFAAGPSGLFGWGFPDYATQRLYAIGGTDLYCLDVSDPLNVQGCPGYPFSATSEIGPYGRQESSRANVMPKTSKLILSGPLGTLCVETAGGAPRACDSWGRIAVNLVLGESIAIPNERGVAIGFCIMSKSDAKAHRFCRL